MDNKTGKNASKSHGEVLSEIAHCMMSVIPDKPCVYVRERGFSRFAAETQALFKVVGISDLIAWDTDRAVFEELAPMTVKRL